MVNLYATNKVQPPIPVLYRIADILKIDVRETFNMVNLYATNKVQPPIPVLYRIADILKIDVRELLIPNKLDTK